MGINRTALLLSTSLLFVSTLAAAPKLRLSATSVGPVPVAAGASVSIAGVHASNAGDGSLNLQFSSTAPWLTATAGREGACAGLVRPCTPITLNINAGSLQRGTHTARLSVTSPEALDAPQFIDVTASVGGGSLPERLDVALPVGGGTRTVVLPVASSATVTVNGGSWLTAQRSLDAATGLVSWTLTANSAGLGAGNNNATVQIAGSGVAGENRSIPVALQVTSQPIAAVPSTPIRVRLAANATRQTIPYALANSGSGQLSITGATPTLTGGTWLTTEVRDGLIWMAFNPAGMTPGVYTGTVAVASNAVNASQAIPVTFEVLAAGAPHAFGMGAVNNATFEREGFVAPGTIMAVFGEQFTTGEPVHASRIPLDRQLGTTRVLVNGEAAPLYYSSNGQINFQLPYETPAGTATVRVERDGQLGNPVSVDVLERSPYILPLAGGPYGIIKHVDDAFVAPRGYLGLNARPARPGDVLVIYAIGLGQTTPPARTGEAATGDPLLRVPGYRVVLGEPNPFFAGLEIPAQFAGLTPGLVGLYQVNFQIPENAPKGDVVATVLLGDGGRSNRIVIAIE